MSLLNHSRRTTIEYSRTERRRSRSSRLPARSLAILLITSLLGGSVFASSRTILMGVTHEGKLQAYGVDGLIGENYRITWQEVVSNFWSGITTHAGNGVLFYISDGKLLSYHVVGTSSGLKVYGPKQTIKNTGFDNVDAMTTDGAQLLWVRNRTTKQIDLYHYSITGPDKRVELTQKFPARSSSSHHFVHLKGRELLFADSKTALVRPYRMTQKGDVTWTNGIIPEAHWSVELLAANGSDIFFIRNGQLHYRTHYSQEPKTFSGTSGWSGLFKCLFTIPGAELPIVSQDYTVTVKTADDDGAGTDDNVGLTFVGSNGVVSQEYLVNKQVKGNVLERGASETFTFEPAGAEKSLNYVASLRLYKRGTIGQGWKAESITVAPRYSPTSVFDLAKSGTINSTNGSVKYWVLTPAPPAGVLARGESAEQLEDSFIYLMEYANAVNSTRPEESGKEYTETVSNEKIVTNTAGLRLMTDFGISLTYNHGVAENVGPSLSVSGHLRQEVEITRERSNSESQKSERVVVSNDKVTADPGTIQFKMRSYKVKTRIDYFTRPTTYQELVSLQVIKVTSDSGSTGYTFPKAGPAGDTVTWNKYIAPVFVRVKSKGEYKTLVEDLQSKGILTTDAITAAEAIEG